MPIKSARFILRAPARTGKKDVSRRIPLKTQKGLLTSAAIDPEDPASFSGSCEVSHRLELRES